MADVISKLNQKAADALEEGERFLAGQPMTVKGRNALAAWADGIALDEVLPNYVAQHGQTENLDVADETVPTAFLAALTDRRVLLFSRSLTGSPKELVESHDLVATTLDVVDTGDRARSRVFVFGSPSGQVFAGECGINGKALQAADAFVEAWMSAESN